MSQSGQEDFSSCIAIVGMACRFPGASTIEEFWQNLRNGVESISFFSDDELDSAVVDPAERRDPRYVKARATLDDVELFDAALFGFTPREAELTDPQHRIFLECAFTALEHAGYNPWRYRGSIGTFGGAGANTYMLFHLASAGRLVGSAPTLQAFIHNKNDHLTTRTAYKLNLRGPAVTVQTACSTSLVAVSLAVQSLLSCQIDMAIAGGAGISVPQRVGYLYHDGGIGSPDGHCRAFDADAKGTVGGNGAGVVVLKRYEDAVADGDTIYAVLRGIATNNDGAARVGYTAPGADSQAEVISLAQALAGVEPDTISYVEAHGTGTPIGDPIEIDALTKAFRRGTDKRGFCAVGAVKSNIGHLDTAAGIAGLIKTVLALQHRQIPPSLHFKTPNPRIDFAHSPFYVNTTLKEWRAAGGPRRAGVSSFGLGGTNAHAILEEAPPPVPSGPARPRHLLVLSAQTDSALERLCRDLADHLKKNPGVPLADVAYTLQVGRKELPHRRMAVCRDVSDAVAVLEALSPERVFTREQEPVPRPVTFMFPGQGAQFPNMGADLYRSEPVFREHVDRCCDLLVRHLGLDLRTHLFPAPGREEEATRTLARTDYTQPALFVIEYAMAQQWMSWGLTPEQMIGHSIGEYVAACLAGVFSLEDALGLVVARGRLMGSVPEGAMLAVPLSERDVQPLLVDGLELAAVNGLAQCVVSGPKAAVDALESRLTAQKHICRRLRTSHAFHSGMMDPIVEEFRRCVAAVERKAPSLRYLSNLTGTWITAQEATDPAYWAAHLRRPVRFADGLAKVLADPNAVLLEVGPGRTLRTLVRWHPHKMPAQVMLASLPHPQEKQSDHEYLLHTMGQLWLSGVALDWEAFYAQERRRHVPLPTYPFERKRYWVDLLPQGMKGRSGAPLGSLRKRPDIADWFYVPTWKADASTALTGSARGAAPLTWLLFEEDSGLTRRIADALASAGHQVSRVRSGPSFADAGDGQYTIDPGRREDYVALAQALRAADRWPRRLVHGWSMAREAALSADESSRRGLHSLVFAAQAFCGQAPEEDLELTVLTSDLYAPLGTEQVSPLKALIVGACQVIPREYAGVRCRLWDVDSAPGAEVPREGLVARLVNDLTTAEEATVVAYRGERRWVRDFAELRLPEMESSASVLRPGGVYLITGGLGGLGLEIAGHLARTAQAKLVLLGRSPLPGRDEWARIAAEGGAASSIIHKLQEMEAAGAEVLPLSADVTDEAALRAAIAQATARFGPLHGVVHAAGVPAGGLIRTRTGEDTAAVLAPKVRGAQLLDEILAGHPLDFFVLFSSLTTVVGRLGQVEYTAANAFLDAFAEERHARTGQFTTAIDWGAWEQVGMAAAHRPDAGKSAGERFDHPLLERRLSHSEKQDVYATDFNVEKHWVLDEHRILGNPVIPGVAYFEMARAALGERVHGKIVELQDVFFLQPLRVRDGETREVRLVLDEAPGGFHFAIQSAQGKSPQDYTLGHIVLRDAEPLRNHDLAAIRQRCNAKELLLAAEEREEDLGPRWHSVQRVNLGHNEVLLYLELPAAFVGDFEHMKFHPALLDRAAGIAKNFLAKDGHYLPLTYKKVQIKAPLERKIYSYARFREEDDPTRETITFDIVLMDEQGRGLVEIEGFSQKRVNNPGVEIRALAAASAARKDGESVGAEADTSTDLDHREILPQEGAAAFARILGARVSPQVVVSVRDLRASIEQSDRVVRERLLKAAAAGPRAVEQSLHPRPELSTPYVAPRNEIEERIASAWKAGLGIDRVGIHDSFFELGGDSLVATQVIFQLEREFGVRIPPVSIFEGATISKLVELFMEGQAKEAPAYKESQNRGEMRRSRARRQGSSERDSQERDDAESED